MTREEDVKRRLDAAIKKAKREMKESEKDPLQEEVDNIDRELGEIRKEKEGITDCFIMDMVDRALTVWQQELKIIGGLISDEKGSRYVLSNGKEIQLKDYGLESFLIKMSEQEAKAFMKVLLNEAQNYFTKLDLDELNALAKKLLDDKVPTSQAK